MYPFDEYHLNHRKALSHVRRSQLLGLLPIGTAMLLLGVRGIQAGPGIWCALGVGIALEMILWSAFEEYQSPRGRAGWAERWMKSVDRWFPYLLVVVQGCFAAITLCMLWFAFCELGFPANLLQHVLFLLLIAVVPLRRLLHVDDANARIPACEILDQFFFYLSIALSTILLTTSFLFLIFPNDNAYITEVPLPALVIWVPAILICAGCVVLFVDFLIRKRTATNSAIRPH